MAELNDVLLFCFFYSGVVLYSLWVTLAKAPLQIEVQRQDRKT